MKSQIFKKNLYLLDNREYTKKQNGDATSSPQVLTLYRYIDIDWWDNTINSLDFVKNYQSLN